MEFNRETREGASYLLLQRTVVEVAARKLINYRQMFGGGSEKEQGCC
jgi:hypothetical protein